MRDTRFMLMFELYKMLVKLVKKLIIWYNNKYKKWR